MKDFSGANIKGTNPSLDWEHWTEVMANDGTHFTTGTVISSGAVRWTPQEDGWLICHSWGAPRGKCNVVDVQSGNLIMTLSQPITNEGGPFRAWIPVYKNRELEFQNNCKNAQAYFIPYL